MSRTGRPLMVGIVGGTGAGKSALSAAVAEQLADLHPVILEQDRYYRDLAGVPPAARARVNFDEPESIDLPLLVRQLEALRDGHEVGAPEYCFATHCRLPQPTPIAAAPLVIAEGLFLFHERRLAALFDVRVFVDAPADVRLARRILRDTATRGRTIDSVIDQYLALVRPMHARYVEPQRRRCDVLVMNEGPLDEAVAAVVRAVRARQAAREARSPLTQDAGG